MRRLLYMLLMLTVFMAACKKDSKQTEATITTTPVTSITSNSASTGGTITSNGGSAISQSGVTYAIHNNPSVSDSLMPGIAVSGSFTSALVNLNANTTYYVRAYAINSSGTGYGSSDSFTTAKGTPTVTTTAISNNQALMVTSGGNIINDGGAPVTARGLVWSTSSHPTTSSFVKIDSTTGTGTFMDTVGNLSLETYYLRAFATNSYGTSYGNEITFTVSTTGTVTDVDGNVYGTIKFGNQTWFTSNLKTSKYQNGDAITDGSDPNFDWTGTKLTTGSYTYPNDSSKYNNQYGKYYNPAAINESRNICPAGWRVPTLGDWETLEYFEGASASDTGTYQLSASPIVDKLLVGGSSGLELQFAGIMFSPGPGQPAGYYPPGNGQNGEYGQYWTTTTRGDGLWGTPDYLGNYALNFNFFGLSSIFITYLSNEFGSVRCIKN